ncbi:MAG: hypothetical protein ACXVB1_14965 [Pseudobdellovibrionaceae bacterium]
MAKKKTFIGINIQYPISRLILDGSKTIETRTYPIPNAYVGQEMVIIETPGKHGDFKARLVGTVIFGECFKYPNKKDFYQDTLKHRVDPDSEWKWVDGNPKWGWVVTSVTSFSKPLPAPEKKGIKYTKNIKL